MVHTLALFFETNNFIVYSVYGQVFFLMGLATVFVRTKHSQLPLAQSLWLLGAFGMAHALFEWGFVFIPVQAEYMPPSIIFVLRILHYILGTLSYVFLFRFGLDLAIGPGQRPLRRLLPWGVFAAWSVMFAGALMSTWPSLAVPSDNAEAAMRYAVALPGASLTAYGLLRQAKQVRAMDMLHIERYLTFAAWAFAAYAFVGGVIVPRVDFLPATLLNYDMLLNTFGIPAAVWRSLCGLAIAYSIVRSLQIFDVELDRMVTAAERAQILSAERDRIGRDMHDGIIQSIYAAGLALEDASYTMESDCEVAKSRIGTVMSALNATIGEIRNYIYNLSMAMEERELPIEAAALVERFRSSSPFTTEFALTGASLQLTQAQSSHLLQILHEALSNVAKHARARRVEVRLAYDRGGVTLSVTDDGVGFDRDLPDGKARAGYHQGLRNMAERAALMQGTFDVSSAKGRGTRVSVRVPCERVRYEVASRPIPQLEDG
ncbi:MAG: sensor histidine kinase [Chloroflexota bacterium]